ncbi:MAG TPA: hypothetical protein VLH39_05345, partial [Magnetospirillaceae bacterium]|nr:hypothetical protein [Magnetospirillaceae bacterium]
DTNDANAVLRYYGYLAPEVKDGASPDERSDVYCLGVHLVKLLTGSVPLPPDSRKVRTRSVSLEYVCNALARRAVPQPVIRVALRALRKDPALRYPACVDLMAELRIFVDERRQESIRRGRADPLADLEALNRGFARHGDAAQAVRSLDTADYFRALSETVSAPDQPISETLYPFQDFSAPEEIRLIEAREIDGAEDDGVLSVDEILGRGVQPAPVVRAGRRHSEPAASIHASYAAAPVTVDTRTAIPRPGPVEARGPVPPVHEPSPPVPVLSAGSVLPLEEDFAGLRWKWVTIPAGKVTGELGDAFQLAFRGRGTFRFIQEPRENALAGAFAELFSRFRYEGFFVDAGLLKPRFAATARMDVTDFIRASRTSIARSLLGEPPGSVRYLRRRLDSTDRIGAFHAPPLDRVLFGRPGEEPDPEAVESEEGIRSIAESLLAIGRRRRPMVLVFRGGEWVDRPLHDLLVHFAQGVGNAPACGFVFYERADVADWHVLFRLKTEA